MVLCRLYRRITKWDGVSLVSAEIFTNGMALCRLYRGEIHIKLALLSVYGVNLLELETSYYPSSLLQQQFLQTPQMMSSSTTSVSVLADEQRA